MTDLLFCVTGLARSGTIWLTRLLADALDIESRTREDRFDYDRDPVVWGAGRSPNFIRRVHYEPDRYHYDSPAILIVRDPRDVCVSQSFFYNKVAKQHFRYLLGKWIRFHLDWFNDQRLKTYTRYEDLHRDPVGELTKLLLNVNGITDIIPTPDRVKQAVADNKFSIMENWAKRQGGTGDWKTHLNDPASKRFWREAKEKRENEIIGRLGY